MLRQVHRRRLVRGRYQHGIAADGFAVKLAGLVAPRVSGKESDGKVWFVSTADVLTPCRESWEIKYAHAAAIVIQRRWRYNHGRGGWCDEGVQLFVLTRCSLPCRAKDGAAEWKKVWVDGGNGVTRKGDDGLP